MADTKISDLVELGGASLDDLLVIVDVDDTSMATSGTNKKIKASNATGLLAPLAGGEVSITGATTATVSRMHVCSGTTADYTVTLPAASGNLGRLIGFRMASGLTKLVTLDGNASETIDGALTRVLWAGEVAILLCDGAGWTKIAGKSRPMTAKLTQATAQTTLASGSFTRLSLDTVAFDDGSIAVTSNSSITAKRTAKYVVTIGFSGSTFPAGTLVILSAYLNGTEVARLFRGSVSSDGFPNFSVAMEIVLSAGDVLDARFFHNAAGNQSTYTDGGVTGAFPFLTAAEVVAW